MVFNATFNNISVISGQSVLLVEEVTEFLKTNYLLRCLVGFELTGE
jgi:hypothetical protein